MGELDSLLDESFAADRARYSELGGLGTVVRVNGDSVSVLSAHPSADEYLAERLRGWTARFKVVVDPANA